MTTKAIHEAPVPTTPPHTSNPAPWVWQNGLGEWAVSTDRGPTRFYKTKGAANRAAARDRKLPRGICRACNATRTFHRCTTEGATCVHCDYCGDIVTPT